MLLHIIFVVAAVIIDDLMGLSFEESGVGVVYIFYALATFLPSLAVSIRRLHDIGKAVG